MLDVKNLHVSAEGAEILKGLDLHVNGQKHARARVVGSSAVRGD
jgi:Fe-S cluster assembly ATPase SufC